MVQKSHLLWNNTRNNFLMNLVTQMQKLIRLCPEMLMGLNTIELLYRNDSFSTSKGAMHGPII